MTSHSLVKAAILAVIIVFSFAASWEYYWRSRGFTPTHNDDKVLWALKRKEIYHTPERSTVFIGGSRIKFDVDIPTWETLTGDEVIQLALVGTPARPILQDLAKDTRFKGKVIIDVAEPQFFTLDSMNREKSARESLEYYNGETPAQRASTFVNYELESRLVLLEEGKFSLTELLEDLRIPDRPGVFTFPQFPKEFGLTTAERQTFMNAKFLSDTALQNTQKRIWSRLLVGGMKRFPAMQGEQLEVFLVHIKTFVDQIRARGGQVIFVRPPSSGILLETEKQTYPRDQYWDRLLKFTNTPGIHFEDYPEIAHFVCPEMSHLSSEDAVTFTKHLVRILEEKHGWAFPGTITSVSYNQKP
jgi:hypothetical protein